MNHQVLIDRLIYRLEEMADKDLQTELWTGMRKGEMSTFDEAVCGIFDDSGLAIDLESGDIDKIWPREVCAKARLLGDLINQIPNKEGPVAIINNPKMENIRKIAGEILGFLQEREKSLEGRERS